jgi:glycosyltransferase involved in cell wall biosynthesis
LDILFSIILPTFNRAHKLHHSINSVLAQIYINYELIIVDDGSEDDTHKIVSSYNNNRIKYIFQKNQGVCAARNKGILASKGSYITFIDSDDKADEEWLYNFNMCFNRHKSDIVFCDMNLHYPDGKIKLRKALYRYSDRIRSENGMFMPGSFAIKAEILKSIGGFDENIRFGEFTDIDFTLQNLNITRSFTNKVGLHYFPAIDGGGKNQLNKVNSINYFLTKHKYYFKKNKYTKWLYLQNAAISYIRLNQFKLARKYFLNAFFVRPWKFKTIFRFLISLSPLLSKQIWKKSF